MLVVIRQGEIDIHIIWLFQHAAVALSAFINGMYELDTVAIVRYCRQKNAAPKLGFLSPHIKQDYEVCMKIHCS